MSEWQVLYAHIVEFAATRLSTSTVFFAIVSSAGGVLVYLGLTATQRVSIAGEMKRLSNIREPGWREALTMRLRQAGVDVSLTEFAGVGFVLGGLLGGVMMLAGFVTFGVLMIPSGMLLYHQLIMRRRVKAVEEMREQLPDAICDAAEYYATYQSIDVMVRKMAEQGPLALRGTFEQVERYQRVLGGLHGALQLSAYSRPEIFFRQFFLALAQHTQTGAANLRDILLRIADAQRTQLKLQRRIKAQQAGGRMVGLIYGFAPPAFLLFSRLFSGGEFVTFYATLTGQLVQVLVLASGLLTWWLTGKIASRGIYLDDDARAPHLDRAVRLPGFDIPRAGDPKTQPPGLEGVSP
jgi:Flp pilus assembly protein TadB